MSRRAQQVHVVNHRADCGLASSAGIIVYLPMIWDSKREIQVIMNSWWTRSLYDLKLVHAKDRVTLNIIWGASTVLRSLTATTEVCVVNWLLRFFYFFVVVRVSIEFINALQTISTLCAAMSNSIILISDFFVCVALVMTEEQLFIDEFPRFQMCNSLIPSSDNMESTRLGLLNNWSCFYKRIPLFADIFILNLL